jgi:hypothetical protein
MSDVPGNKQLSDQQQSTGATQPATINPQQANHED